ncbi:NFATC2-interacting protein [Osmerus mordax]|uniref:NFATC2-interacting protein n=1 Tax=Osmerus mordax TaxID=8014 RepID=UPI00350F1B4F
MAETISDSDSDVEVPVSVKPQPKRRRIDPSSISSVSVYSNKVNSSLQLKPTAFIQSDTAGGNTEASLCVQSVKQPICIVLSDSEEESEELEKSTPRIDIRSPSPPPPPDSPAMKVSKRANQKIREIDRKLDSIGSLISPPPEVKAIELEYPTQLDDSDDDDNIILSASKAWSRSQPPTKEEIPLTSREFTLKFRCRTDLYKIPVISTAPLSKAVDQLSAKLKVLPSRILLLRSDTELPVHSSANELGLGIVDIIDCVIIAADEKLDPMDKGGMITLRLQGKEKGSAQEFSIHKCAPLGSILNQYLSNVVTDARRKVHFLFDGSKVTNIQTPSQLDMEDGDVIEVWA